MIKNKKIINLIGIIFFVFFLVIALISCSNLSLDTGTLLITSIPSGAVVWIDGVMTEYNTPCQFELTTGIYTVKLTAEGFGDWESTISITAGESKVLDIALPWIVAHEIVIQPNVLEGKDAYVNYQNPTVNYGDEHSLKAGSTHVPMNDFYHAYLQFDLSSIPNEIIIIQARLALCFVGTDIPEEESEITVYQVESPWEEKTLNWDNQPTVHNLALDTVILSGQPDLQFHYWDITTLVTDWLSELSINYGIMLGDSNESSYEQMKGFVSSDSVNLEEYRPQLTIDYYYP